ncbi:MAG: tryptophan--tRNA ligase [Pseudomonadota bacterium]
MLKERVFSGMQPTGSLTLGNYLGAMVQWIRMQETTECIYCIVDLHAVTVWQDPTELEDAIRTVAAAYVACGLDPEKSIIFNQSQVQEHAELGWILNCVARLGWLNRMTQFKEKAGKDRENASVGLFTYPCLMAADILAYRATHVPVGDDQKQHLELSRDIAQKFNNDFRDRIRDAAARSDLPDMIDDDGEIAGYFPLPEPVISGPATRVMSLRDGTRKMSKSEPSEMSRINLSDDADTIAQKIRKAKTDPDALPSEPDGLQGRPEADNLVGIYAALSGTDKAGVLRDHGGAQFSAFKPALADLAVAKLGPIGAEMARLTGDPAELDRILCDGADRARAIAAPIVADVRDIVGFVQRRSC